MCLLRGTDWIFIYNSTFCPHTEFMCFMWIREQTAITSLYSINWLVFITQTECVYCAVRTGFLYIILRSAHSVFMCFVWICEQTAIISLYSINWLVFVTETECVYCAVRTGSLNMIQADHLFTVYLLTRQRIIQQTTTTSLFAFIKYFSCLQYSQGRTQLVTRTNQNNFCLGVKL